MATAFHCSVGVKPNGIPYWDLWTTPGAERLGIAHVSVTTALDSLRDDGDAPGYHVGVALALAALGSKLLRMAELVGSQRPLFPLDVQ